MTFDPNKLNDADKALIAGWARRLPAGAKEQAAAVATEEQVRAQASEPLPDSKSKGR